MIHSKFIKTTLYEYLNEEIDNTNTNFKKWFGDSKIVGKDGNPLIVYHGSSSDFNIFKYDTYFTDDYFNADGYANGEYVYEVYLSIKKPMIIDCKGKKWDKIDTPLGSTTQEVVGNVNREIYDGIIFINVKDNWIDDEDYQDPGVVYVPFSPNQIKSIDNNGTWSPSNDDIYS